MELRLITQNYMHSVPRQRCSTPQVYHFSRKKLPWLVVQYSLGDYLREVLASSVTPGVTPSHTTKQELVCFQPVSICSFKRRSQTKMADMMLLALCQSLEETVPPRPTLHCSQETSFNSYVTALMTGGYETLCLSVV